MGDQASRSQDPSPAEQLFYEYLEHSERSEPVSFEDFCREHPSLDGELRELQAAWRFLDPKASRLDGAWSAEVASRLMGDAGSGSLDWSAEADQLEATGKAAERYKTVGEIGRGGMGIVERAWDPLLHRSVARKICPVRRADGETGLTAAAKERLVARFLDEAQITSQLDHPGIVPLHELGLDDAGHVFFTMQLVSGRDLREAFQDCLRGSTEWTLPRILRVLLTVSEIVAFAHSRGVIHRDLKPANVMIGSFGEVYLMDWGLAKILATLKMSEVAEPVETLRSAATDDGVQTRAGAVVGTPAYMSPEQATGGEVGPASDVYSIGAMLYELMAGHPPYGDPDTTRSADEYLSSLLTGPPRPIRDRARRSPAELISICERAMAREPSARYAEAARLTDDLRAFLDGRVVRAHATGPFVELKKWMQRNRGLSWSLFGLFLALVAGSVISLQLARQAARDRDEALWQSYVANLVAADANWREGKITAAKSRLEKAPLVMRSFEWNLVRRWADASSLTMTGHSYHIWNVDVSADGRRAYSCAGDATARVWDLASGESIRVLEDHTGRVFSIAADPTGRRLASGSSDKMVRLRDAETFETVAVLEGHDDGIFALAFSPNGELLASGANNGSLRLWHGQTGELLRILPGHAEWIWCLAFSPDGRQLVTGSTDDTLIVWDVATGDVRRTLRGHEADVTALAFLPDGKTLFSGDVAGGLLEWETGSGEQLRDLDGHPDCIAGISVSADGKWIATASRDRTIGWWNQESGQLVYQIPGHEGFVRSVKFAGDRLVSGGWDNCVKVWSVGELGRRAFPLTRGQARGFAVNDADLYLVRDEELVWEKVDSGRVQERVSVLSEVRLDPWSSELLVQTIRPKKNGEPAVFLSPFGSPGDAAPRLSGWSVVGADPVRGVLTVVNSANELFLHEVDSGRMRGPLAQFDDRPLSIAFHPKHPWLVVAAAEPRIRIFDLALGTTIRELNHHWNNALAVAFDPTGAVLATAGVEGEVYLLDSVDFQEVAVLRGHDASVVDVCFHPFEPRVATSSEDHTIKIWSTKTWEELLTLRGHDAFVVQIEFTADGQTLVSRDSSGRVLLWDGRPIGD